MAEPPNILFLFPDQLRADFLGCYGASFVSTPHIDALSEGGVRFERAYSGHPLCVPARVGLLTGLHALRTGVLDNGQFLRPDYEACGYSLWPEMLAEAGYYTAAIGKMHFYPWDARMGFQYRVIAEDKRWIHIRDDYYHFLKQHSLVKLHGNEHEGYYANRGAVVSRIPWECSVDHFVGQEACRFIREHATEEPFAMMVGFPGPHCPYDPTPEYLDRVSPGDMPAAVPEVPGDTPQLRSNNIAGNLEAWNGVDYTVFTDAHKRKIRAHYAALVEQIDHEVGEIMAALRERGVLENTLIVFAADHGDSLGDHNLIGKGHYYESSIHVPLIVRQPGAVAGGTCNQLVALTDLTATLLQSAGVAVPGHMDARPLPGLATSRAGDGRDHLVGAITGGWMIDDGSWRLARYSTGETTLYDRAEDPDEQQNRAHDRSCQRAREELDARLQAEVMQYLRQAFYPQRVYVHDLSQEPGFGREGWRRPYPRSVSDC